MVISKIFITVDQKQLEVGNCMQAFDWYKFGDREPP